MIWVVNEVTVQISWVAGLFRVDQHSVINPQVWQSGEKSDEQIAALKDLNPDVEGVFFDILLAIQQITSSKVHEKAHDGWESRHLRAILRAVIEILNAIFVLPAEREKRREAILKIKLELTAEESAGQAPQPEVAVEALPEARGQRVELGAQAVGRGDLVQADGQGGDGVAPLLRRPDGVDLNRERGDGLFG